MPLLWVDVPVVPVVPAPVVVLPPEVVDPLEPEVAAMVVAGEEPVAFKQLVDPEPHVRAYIYQRKSLLTACLNGERSRL